MGMEGGGKQCQGSFEIPPQEEGLESWSVFDPNTRSSSVLVPRQRSHTPSPKIATFGSGPTCSQNLPSFLPSFHERSSPHDITSPAWFPVSPSATSERKRLASSSLTDSFLVWRCREGSGMLQSSGYSGYCAGYSGITDIDRCSGRRRPLPDE